MSQPHEFEAREEYLENIRDRFAKALKEGDDELIVGIFDDLNSKGFIYEYQALKHQYDSQQEKEI